MVRRQKSAGSRVRRKRTASPEPVVLEPGASGPAAVERAAALVDEAKPYLQVDDQEAAEARLQAAVAAAPGYAPAHALISFIRVRQGNLLEALESAELASSLDPNSPDVQNIVGSVYCAAGRLPEAEQVFRRALELQPGGREPLWNLAQLAFARELYDDAIEWYRQLLALDPSDTRVLNAITECYNRIITASAGTGF